MEHQDFSKIDSIFQQAWDQGRHSLYEFEVYQILKHLGLDVPGFIFIPREQSLSDKELATLSSERLVCKVVAPSIVHKSDVGGVQFVPRDLAAVQAACEQLCQISPDVRGVLVSSLVPYTQGAFGHEILASIRWDDQFGPVLAVGTGGLDTEFFEARFQKGKSLVLAAAELLDSSQIVSWMSRLAIYEKLSGQTRDQQRLVSDDQLVSIVTAFQHLARHYSHLNPASDYAIMEMEVNPFVVSQGKLVAIDGLLRFEKQQTIAKKHARAQITALLKPRSIAVMGVSTKMNIGHTILNNIIRTFPKEQVFVIKQGLDSLEGCRCYAQLQDLPHPVDLLVISLGAEQLPAVMEEVITHQRAQAVILIAGGMGEKEGGEQIEKSIKALLQKRQPEQGPVVVGGNCMGVISQPGGYDTFFIPPYKLPKDEYHSLPAAIVSQSGAFVCARMSKLQARFCYAISTGNQIDLSFPDYLDYLQDDPAVEVLSFYVEGFQPLDGLRFAQTARRAVANKQDILLYKAGRTSQGRDAAKGHTASMAGTYTVCREILASQGVLMIEHLDDFEALVQLFAYLRQSVVKGTRLGLMSNAGFETVGMADNFQQATGQLQLPQLSPATREKILQAYSLVKIQEIANIRNPLDITPVASDEVYELCARALLEDPAIDAVVIGIVPATPALQTLASAPGHPEDLTHPQAIAARLIRLKAEYDKPFVTAVDSGSLYDPLAQALQRGGIPTFRSANHAVAMLGQYLYYKMKQSKQSD